MGASAAGVLAACSAILGIEDVRLGRDSGAGDADEPRPDGSLAPDSSPDGAPVSCDPNATFGAPALVGGVNTAAEEMFVSLAADERTIYFSRIVDGGWDLFLARRASRGDAFDPPAPIDDLNSAKHEVSPTLTPDERTAFFASDRAGGQGDIFVATRPAAAGNFLAPTVVPALASPYDEYPCVLRSDGSELWFSSKRFFDGGNFDIYRATVIGGTPSEPVRVEELASTNDELGTAVSGDGLVVFFASNRPGGQTPDAHNIWTARRSSSAAAFGPPQLVNELVSQESRFPAWLSPDGCRLYLTSNTDGGVGGSDVWVAHRPPLPR